MHAALRDGCARSIMSALERLSPVETDPVVVLTVPVRSALTACDAYARMTAAEPGMPLLLWETPAGPGLGGPGWSFAGLGEAWRFDAGGEDRIEATRARAGAWLAGVHAWTDPACDAPSPRLFGGFAFRAGEVRDGPWRGFADASFAMPRWLFGRAGERAILRLAVRREELGDPAALAGEVVRMAELLERDPATSRRPAVESIRACVAPASRDAWAALVGGALGRIRSRELHKVVTATQARVLSARPIQIATLLARLGDAYPETIRFAFTRGGATFLGATPERLVSQRGLTVDVDALAGTARRSAPGEDASVVSALVASDKDRREHAHVVEAVARALRPLSRILDVPATPRVRSLRNVHHLWSPIRATRSRAGHVLDLVELLHPTPAVCGTPRDAALGWIAAHEPIQRGWYAGAVGWFDGAGDGAFAVAIRSAVVEQHEAWLYGGAGIVDGSDAAAEYDEVRTKQAPMLSALGVLP